MADDFVIARTPDPDSALPYLLRIPLPGRPVVLKARETWPRTSKVYCHRADEWPDEPDIVERVPVTACSARGPAVDLVLARGRENRSQLVFTRLKGGREAIFWQSPRTTRKARPGVRTPTARASGLDNLEIVVDGRERYAYRFASQQATAVKGSLPCGDYGVRRDGVLVGVVERKSLDDLARSLIDGRLPAQMGELAAARHAAVVVEERYSRLFTLPFVKPGFVADLLARVQVRWPSVAGAARLGTRTHPRRRRRRLPAGALQLTAARAGGRSYCVAVGASSGAAEPSVSWSCNGIAPVRYFST